MRRLGLRAEHVERLRGRALDRASACRARARRVIGDDDLATEVVSALETSGATVEHLAEPDQEDVHRTVEAGGIEAVVVVARKDAFVLRMALLVRSASERNLPSC